ncbi:valine--tRNA ligase [Patescibacteria group bacterium]|nr:valine--tRNA ligase [Patescibacteria group bacterium]
MDEKLLKPYDPKATEDRIYKLWEESGFFNPDNLPKNHKLKTKNYCITIPPPNITGSLHMGHALNATIQDILIRKKRMQGYKTLWLPGTDHAGIATQNVVEKELKKQGLSRHDLGREKFIQKVWEWKEKYGNIILDQLKKLGSSCDWSRTRFTMDEGYVKSVETAFLHYYKKGWIYQGDRVVNWCTRCQTSLSDLELEYEDVKGKLYYIKYGSLTVATTRPETMLGDSAVAVNPKDKRYKNFIGKKVILPIMNREIPVIADSAVEMEFGTGAVKVTPAHDITDFEISERHKLPAYQVINQFGKMTLQQAQGKPNKIIEELDGLKTKEAREKITKELEAQGLIEKIEDYDLRVSKCYRCGSVIEPQISKQWFLKMAELAKKAKESVKKGHVAFHPKKWEKVYFDWFNPPTGGIKDWCISRQIWWGHKIPLENTDDVLDTWFSSALWPFAVFNKSDLKKFYPTQVLSTARDIINLWVARMIFSGLEFMKKEPFKDVIIHPTILTKEGKRMSKSLGTGTDPIVLIEKYGADATRFGLIYQMMGGQDIHFNEDHVLAGKKFCNKIWNISRFVLTQIGNSKIQITNYKQIQKSKLQKENKEILDKLEKTIKTVNKDLNQYKFGQALHTIYDFTWHDFADNYIEYSKNSKSEETLYTLYLILNTVLILLHPFMPFITEEIWDMIPTDLRCRWNTDIVSHNLLIIEKWVS